MRFSILILTLILIAGAMTGIAGASISTGDVTPATTEVPTAVQPVVTEEPFSTPSVVPTQLPFTPAPGSQYGFFQINSNPSGADCYFDGQWQGETPVTVQVSTTGNPSHTIMLSLEGYQTLTKTYNGNPGNGQTIVLTYSLTPVQQLGSIQVTSTPSGATTILDGSLSGITPYTFTGVPVGSHNVQVYLSGYQTFYTTVSVSTGQTAYVTATLAPTVTVGSLSVTSSPSGAGVYVDGGYWGSTPATVGNLQAGNHNVEIIKAGYQTWKNTVTIVAGQTYYLNAQLVADPKPQYATVSIVSNPSGADVYADGKFVGKTQPGYPIVSNSVVPGTHTILLTKAGYQDYTSTGTVVAGKNYDLTINLVPVPNPTTGGISITSNPLGAEAYVNNVFKGLTPVTVDGLTPGSYGVLVRLNGYQDWQSSVMVSSGKTEQVSAVLIPAPIRTQTTPATPAPTPTQTPLLPATAVIGLLAGAGIVLFLRKNTR
jgi:hypothetical protein